MYFVENQHASIRNASVYLNISYSCVQRTLKKHKWHPFKITLVQQLRVGDTERRFSFIQWLINKKDVEPLIFNNILWTDKSKFMTNEILNRHNAHYWTNENPHRMRESKFQTFTGVNVWCGNIGNQLIGPHFYSGQYLF